MSGYSTVDRAADTAARSAEDEALRWLADFDNLSEVEQARFHAWLDERPENGEAFEKLEAEWRRLDALRQLATAEPDPRVVEKWLRLRRFRRRYLPLAAAAAIAALAVIFARMPQETYEAHYLTAVGEHERVAMPDGSVVVLNTGSEMVVSYGPEERHVRLARGEAHFEVMPDPERPFSVAAGTGLVVAVGTAFNVHLKGEAVEVLVTEGSVEIRPDALRAATPPKPSRGAGAGKAKRGLPAGQRLAAGHRAEYRDTIESVSPVDPEEIERKLAWQAGMLDFRDATLAEVVEEASRYTETRIVVADPEIRELHVTGYLKAGDIDTLLELIASNEQVVVQHTAPNLVHIVAKRD